MARLGPTQAEIIEEQALALAELRDFKARAKLRLKEAAARLREYRTRADALVAELAEAKRALQAARDARAEAPRQRRAATRAVAVQTERLAVDASAQTEAEAPRAARRREQSCPTEAEAGKARGDGGEALQPVRFDGLPFSDATSAAIDAELAMSDSEDEDTGAKAALQRAPTLDEIASAIDDELQMSNDEQEETKPIDAIGDAIDAELATSDSEDEQPPTETKVSAFGKTEATVKKGEVSSAATRAQLLKSIDDEIDAELASSSDEEPAAHPKNMPTKIGKEEPSSSSSDSSDSSDDDDDDENKKNNDVVASASDLQVDLNLHASALQAESKAAGDGSRSGSAEILTLDADREIELSPKKATGSLWLIAKHSGSQCSSAENIAAELPSRMAVKNSKPELLPRSGSSDTEEFTTDEAESVTGKTNATSTSEASSRVLVVETAAIADEASTMTSEVRASHPNAERDGPSLSNASPSTILARKRGINDVGFDSFGTTEHNSTKKQKADEDIDISEEEGAIHSAVKPSNKADAQSSESRAVAPSSEPSAKAQKKRELFLKKAQQAFNREIARADGEELNEQYVARTISALVRCSSAFQVSHPEHVSKLCSRLSKTFRDNDMSPTLVLQGILRVFRVPRTRKKLENESIGICELCQKVLLDTMVISGTGVKAVYRELDLCLDILRDLVIEGRTLLDNSMPSGGDASTHLKLVSDWRSKTSATTATLDKAFLVHICTLHALLCRSTSLLHRSRVLLFDVVCSYANIKGLLLASMMIEVSPELLIADFDDKCQERKLILKDTLMYALVVITSITSMKQQELFGESGVEMFHRILRAIQNDNMDGVDGADPSYQRRFATQISNAVFAPPDDVMASKEALIQIGKSLELLAAVHGVDFLAREFRLTLFQELFDEYDASSNQPGKEWTIGVLGQVVHTVISCRTKAESSGISLVERIAEWLVELLALHPSDETRTWQLQSALTAADLAMGATMLDISCRRRCMLAILQWFEQQPPHWLMELPAGYLRRLRTAILTTRPLCPLQPNVNVK